MLDISQLRAVRCAPGQKKSRASIALCRKVRTFAPAFEEQPRRAQENGVL